MTATAIDQLINHIALVLDASTSMAKHEKAVVEVAKAEIANLAEKSKDFNQETRISIYSFSDPHNIKCLVYDKDVLRLPDITDMFRIGGNTALIDATMQSVLDLEQTAQIYGDHAFFLMVVTDGQENQSRKYSKFDLKSKFDKLSDNWTIMALVPDRAGIADAAYVGFPNGNIATWNTQSAKGFEEVGKTFRSAVTQFYTNRSQGIRGSKYLIAVDPGKIKTTDLKTKLNVLPDNSYSLYPVLSRVQIQPFVESKIGYYKQGCAYYQLMKKETIQPNKDVLVYEKATGRVYSGPEARRLVGLPTDGSEAYVTPTYSDKYDIYVQSTSVNRNLIPGTTLLVTKF